MTKTIRIKKHSYSVPYGSCKDEWLAYCPKCGCHLVIEADHVKLIASFTCRMCKGIVKCIWNESYLWRRRGRNGKWVIYDKWKFYTKLAK